MWSKSIYRRLTWQVSDCFFAHKCRLLRNRVSAQQARERKKAYLSDLEVRSKELQQRNEELEEKVSTLQRENYMLRQVSLCRRRRLPPFCFEPEYTTSYSYFFKRLTLPCHMWIHKFISCRPFTLFELSRHC